MLFLFGRRAERGPFEVEAGDSGVINKFDGGHGIGGSRERRSRGDLPIHFFQGNGLKALKWVLEPIIGHLAFVDRGERKVDFSVLTGGGRGLLVLIQRQLAGQMLVLTFTGFFAQWYYLHIGSLSGRAVVGALPGEVGRIVASSRYKISTETRKKVFIFWGLSVLTIGNINTTDANEERRGERKRKSLPIRQAQ